MTTWMYEEFEHCGVDYSNDHIADTYDEKHAFLP